MQHRICLVPLSDTPRENRTSPYYVWRPIPPLVLSLSDSQLVASLSKQTCQLPLPQLPRFQSPPPQIEFATVCDYSVGFVAPNTLAAVLPTPSIAFPVPKARYIVSRYPQPDTFSNPLVKPDPSHVSPIQCPPHAPSLPPAIDRAPLPANRDPNADWPAVRRPYWTTVPAPCTLTFPSCSPPPSWSPKTPTAPPWLTPPRSSPALSQNRST